jgi:RimJ/RimL family protein N-acetyltransferase
MFKKTTILNGEKLTISSASIVDGPEIINFLNKVGGETDFLTFGHEAFPYSLEQQQKTVAEALALQQCLMLVGKINDCIIAQLFLQRLSHERTCHVGEIAITVDKKKWGQGIAKNMIGQAIIWAQNHNITKLQLQV